MVNKKRRMVGEELAMANKGLENKKADVEWLKYQIEYYDLMLSKGLEINYNKTLREFKQTKKQYEQELELNKKIVEQLQDQIRNGVVIREDKVEDKVEENKEEKEKDNENKIEKEDK